LEAAVSAAVLSDAALRLPEIARIRGMSLGRDFKEFEELQEFKEENSE
jgi:hypothetical protein